MTTTKNYDAEARQDAVNMAKEFADQIIQQLREGGEASTDHNNDYQDGDSYHHENHVDRSYDLLEAATLLDQLSDHTETDWGLWQGLEPRRAIGAQAAYTYGNAVTYYWSRIISAINEDVQGGILADMLGEDDPASDDEITGRIAELAQEAV